MNMSQVDQYYANHRWFVIGGAAAALAAAFGFIQLRKTPTAPIINVAAPASSSSQESADALASTLAASQQNLSALAALLQSWGQPPVYVAPPVEPTPPEAAPPVSPPATTPPPESTAPVASGALHVARLLSPPVSLWRWQNGQMSLVPGWAFGSAVFTVQQAAVEGTTWWVIADASGYAGYYIKYHDPAWSVSP
jgi:hypothetical protein